jgi:hypothetical protein
MRIFVGYGYHERDRWIEDLVLPLVRAFGFEPLSGKEIYGQRLSDGVKETIARSDALLGFATKRMDQDGSERGTHRWVTDELATAANIPIPLVEVREEGLAQGGIVGDRQYIVYKELERDKCLVEIATTLGIWRDTLPIRVKLIPDDLVEEIWPNVRKPGFRCTYTLLEGLRESAAFPAKLLPIKGGLFVELRNVRSNTLVSVAVEYGGIVWSSGYESVDTASVRLQR